MVSVIKPIQIVSLYNIVLFLKKNTMQVLMIGSQFTENVSSKSNNWNSACNYIGCNGFYIQFRQSFAKETFFYDEYLKS